MVITGIIIVAVCFLMAFLDAMTIGFQQKSYNADDARYRFICLRGVGLGAQDVLGVGWGHGHLDDGFSEHQLLS